MNKSGALDGNEAMQVFGLMKVFFQSGKKEDDEDDEEDKDEKKRVESAYF